VFERFSSPARRVVLHARSAVSRIGGRAIDSDFLLLGLAEEAPELFEELGALGLAEAIAADRESEQKPAPDADVPLANDGLSALEAAVKESRRLGAKQVGLAHLLLGLLADHASPAGKRLSGLGIVAEQVRSLAREKRILALDERP
jgi:ATP-dependent Clp protease ATP-binding subunit ClpA